MKVMVAIANSDVAPRFDLAVEAVIAEIAEGAVEAEPRIIVLSEASADELCALAVREGVEAMICGGIDDVHYEYLRWKNIRVIDNVIGTYELALQVFARDELSSDAILQGSYENG